MKAKHMSNTDKIPVICTGCGKKYKAPKSDSIKKYTCKICHTVIEVKPTDFSNRISLTSEGSSQSRHTVTQKSSSSNTKQNNRTKYIILLIIGIILTILAQSFSIYNPNAYTIGGILAVLLIQPIAYSIILGLIALIMASIRKHIKRYWLVIFS